MALLVNPIKLKEHLIILPNIFQKKDKGILPNTFYKADITLIQKPDNDHTHKNKLHANIIDEHKCKNLKHIEKEQYIKRIIHHIQEQVIPGCKDGWFTVPKSINVIHCINKIKDENDIIISIEEEKAFGPDPCGSVLWALSHKTISIPGQGTCLSCGPGPLLRVARDN